VFKLRFEVDGSYTLETGLRLLEPLFNI